MSVCFLDHAPLSSLMRNCPPPSDPVATAESPHVPYCDSSEALGALLRFTVGGKSADAILSLLLCQAKDNISAFHSYFGGKID